MCLVIVNKYEWAFSGTNIHGNLFRVTTGGGAVRCIMLIMALATSLMQNSALRVDPRARDSALVNLIMTGATPIERSRDEKPAAIPLFWGVE